MGLHYFANVVLSFTFQNMALTAEELSKWNVEALRKYLNDRGVPMSGSCRKADMIEKATFAVTSQKLVLQKNGL